jgi:hypothetical protein
MVRALFLLLVLGNLVFYIWAAGYLGGRDEGREPERLRAQVEPARMEVRVLSGTAQSSPGCRQVAPIPVATAEGLKLALEGKTGVAVQLLPKTLTSYWVSIPSLGSKAAAEKKTAELKQLGISDFFVVNDPGPNLHGISLGLFHTEESANERLQQLGRKGVKSARIETRPRPAEQAGLEIRGTAEFLAKQLPDVLASFSVTDAGECAPPSPAQ